MEFKIPDKMAAKVAEASVRFNRYTPDGHIAFDELIVYAAKTSYRDTPLIGHYAAKIYVDNAHA